jgi:hypothetical protein
MTTEAAEVTLDFVLKADAEWLERLLMQHVRRLHQRRNYKVYSFARSLILSRLRELDAAAARQAEARADARQAEHFAARAVAPKLIQLEL